MDVIIITFLPFDANFRQKNRQFSYVKIWKKKKTKVFGGTQNLKKFVLGGEI